MLFSSPIFLFLFLPFVLTLYFLVPKHFRNLFLVAASLVFYYWGEKRYILIMVVSFFANYLFALVLGRRKFILVVAVAVNLGLLIFFKYTNFLVANLLRVLGTDATFFYVPPIHLPLGISFFTFHALSYLFDIYRGQAPAPKSLVDTALYISFFPQLIAGPIIRYRDVAGQLIKRVITLDKFSYGIERFVLGLGKKVLIANVVGAVADQIFALPPNQLTWSVAWLGIICYTLQIYFDFSGYSDMAIGLARLFGFEFLENFNFPYISSSITEFWRRWHISLSNWFRDYLYIPLGGNRLGNVRTYANLLVVFFLCGLWHGASWSFVVWGLWHGLFLVVERLLKNLGVTITGALGHGYALLIIIIGWVFFRSPTLVGAVSYLQAMFNFGTVNKLSGFLSYLNSEVLLVLGIAILFSAPISRLRITFTPRLLAPAYIAALSLIFFLSVMSLANGTYNPFIYFRF